MECFSRWLTLLLGELVQQTGLPDAHIADDDVLEDVVVIVRTARHDDLYLRYFWNMNIRVLDSI